MFSGLFLPMFSREFQNNSIRDDKFEDSPKKKKAEEIDRLHWKLLFWFFDWLPERTSQRLKQLETDSEEDEKL